MAAFDSTELLEPSASSVAGEHARVVIVIVIKLATIQNSRGQMRNIGLLLIELFIRRVVTVAIADLIEIRGIAATESLIPGAG